MQALIAMNVSKLMQLDITSVTPGIVDQGAIYSVYIYIVIYALYLPSSNPRMNTGAIHET